MIACSYDKYFANGSLFEVCQPLFSSKCEFKFVMVSIRGTITPCLFFSNRINLKKYGGANLEILQVRHPENDWTLSSGCIIEKPTDPPINIGVNYCGVLVVNSLPLLGSLPLLRYIKSEYIEIKVSQIGETVRRPYANVHIIDNFNMLIEYLDWISSKYTIDNLARLLGNCLSSARFIQDLDLNDFLIHHESADHHDEELEKDTSHVYRYCSEPNQAELGIQSFHTEIMNRFVVELHHPKFMGDNPYITHQLMMLRMVNKLLFEDTRVDLMTRIHEVFGILKALKNVYNLSSTFTVRYNETQVYRGDIINLSSVVDPDVDLVGHSELHYEDSRSYSGSFSASSEELKYIIEYTKPIFGTSPVIREALFELPKCVKKDTQSIENKLRVMRFKMEPNLID